MTLTGQLKQVGYSALAAAKSDSRKDRGPLDRISSFLILFYPAALGSAVHFTPLLPALRTAVPNAEIIVCTRALGLEILRHNTDVNRIVETPDPKRQTMAAVRAIRSARPHVPYATLIPAANMRPAIAIAASLAGVRNLVGLASAPKLFRQPISFDPTVSIIENELRIVAALGHPAAQHFEPRVFYSAEDLAYARQLVSRFDHPERSLAVLVTQTSPTQRKSWRSDRFAAAARHLIERHGMNIVLVGAKAERPAVAALKLVIGDDARNFAGHTNLSQLAALLSLCTVGLTLDTGILHVGRAVGLPMAIIAPAWSPPHEWLPLDDPRYVILKNLDLPWAPPDYIIDEVSVDETIEAVDLLLARRLAG